MRKANNVRNLLAVIDFGGATLYQGVDMAGVVWLVDCRCMSPVVLVLLEYTTGDGYTLRRAKALYGHTAPQ